MHPKGYMVKDSVNYNLVLVKDNKEIAEYFPCSKSQYEDDDYFSNDGVSVYDSKLSDAFFYVNYFDYKIYI